MNPKRKNPRNDLRKHYPLILQTGMIITLLIFILAMNVQWKANSNKIDFTKEQELVEMEDIVQTEQQEKPAPPPRPQVPIEVPNDEIIEDQDINLDADINFNDPLDMPPPPEGDEDEEDFFFAAEEMPTLIGGLQKLHDRIDYPERARKAGIEGRVTVQFIVNRKGEIEDPEILRGIGGGCDEEALRVIQDAKFTPGKQRDKPVRVKVAQTIYFRLQN